MSALYKPGNSWSAHRGCFVSDDEVTDSWNNPFPEPLDDDSFFDDYQYANEMKRDLGSTLHSHTMNGSDGNDDDDDSYTTNSFQDEDDEPDILLPPPVLPEKQPLHADDVEQGHRGDQDDEYTDEYNGRGPDGEQAISPQEMQEWKEQRCRKFACILICLGLAVLGLAAVAWKFYFDEKYFSAETATANELPPVEQAQESTTPPTTVSNPTASPLPQSNTPTKSPTVIESTNAPTFLPTVLEDVVDLSEAGVSNLQRNYAVHLAEDTKNGLIIPLILPSLYNETIVQCYEGFWDAGTACPSTDMLFNCSVTEKKSDGDTRFVTLDRDATILLCQDGTVVGVSIHLFVPPSASNNDTQFLQPTLVDMTMSRADNLPIEVNQRNVLVLVERTVTVVAIEPLNKSTDLPSNIFHGDKRALAQNQTNDKILQCPGTNTTTINLVKEGFPLYLFTIEGEQDDRIRITACFNDTIATSTTINLVTNPVLWKPLGPPLVLDSRVYSSSDDGQRVATIVNGTVLVYQLTDNKTEWIAQRLNAHEDAVKMDLADDGSSLAISHASNVEILLYNVTTTKWEFQSRFNVTTNTTITNVSFTNRGIALLVSMTESVTNTSLLRFYDRDGNEWRSSTPDLPLDTAPIPNSDWVVSDTGTTIAVPTYTENDRPNVHIYRFNQSAACNCFSLVEAHQDDLKRTLDANNATNISSLALSADGSFMAIAWSYAVNDTETFSVSVYVHSAEGFWKELGTPLIGTHPSYVDLSADGYTMVLSDSSSPEGKILEYNSIQDTWQITSIIAASRPLSRVSLSSGAAFATATWLNSSFEAVVMQVYQNVNE